jgi:uncharacterized membrane protein affecting hemolysin expression
MRLVFSEGSFDSQVGVTGWLRIAFDAPHAAAAQRLCPTCQMSQEIWVPLALTVDLPLFLMASLMLR